MPAARVRRMVEEHDLPGRGRLGELLLEPPRLPGRDRVRVEEEELGVAEPARVVAPGHPERLQLVARHARARSRGCRATPLDAQARPPRPAEGLLPVRAKERGAPQVVVVAERDEHVRRMPRLVALHPLGRAASSPRAADAVVARGQERDLRLRGRRSGQHERQAEEKRDAAQGRRRYWPSDWSTSSVRPFAPCENCDWYVLFIVRRSTVAFSTGLSAGSVRILCSGSVASRGFES